MPAWLGTAAAIAGTWSCVLLLASAWRFGRDWAVLTVVSCWVTVLAAFASDLTNATGRTFWLYLFAVASGFMFVLYLVAVGYITQSKVSELIYRTGGSFADYVTSKESPTRFEVFVRWLGPALLIPFGGLAVFAVLEKWGVR